MVELVPPRDIPRVTPSNQNDLEAVKKALDLANKKNDADLEKLSTEKKEASDETSDKKIEATQEIPDNKIEATQKSAEETKNLKPTEISVFRIPGLFFSNATAVAGATPVKRVKTHLNDMKANSENALQFPKNLQLKLDNLFKTVLQGDTQSALFQLIIFMYALKSEAGTHSNNSDVFIEIKKQAGACCILLDSQIVSTLSDTLAANLKETIFTLYDKSRSSVATFLESCAIIGNSTVEFSPLQTLPFFADLSDILEGIQRLSKNTAPNKVANLSFIEKCFKKAQFQSRALCCELQTDKQFKQEEWQAKNIQLQLSLRCLHTSAIILGTHFQVYNEVTNGNCAALFNILGAIRASHAANPFDRDFAFSNTGSLKDIQQKLEKLQIETANISISYEQGRLFSKKPVSNLPPTPDSNTLNALTTSTVSDNIRDNVSEFNIVKQ